MDLLWVGCWVLRVKWRGFAKLLHDRFDMWPPHAALVPEVCQRRSVGEVVGSHRTAYGHAAAPLPKVELLADALLGKAALRQ